MKASRPRGERGFTLVELLVVIVIISILAAISIPIFFSQREKGLRAQVVSGLRNAATSMQGYATENNGNYARPGGFAPGDAAGDRDWLEDQEWRGAEDISVDIVSADNSGFCIEGTHSSVGTLSLIYESRNATVDDGSCP